MTLQTTHQMIDTNNSNPMKIPSFPLVLTFSNLTYSVKLHSKQPQCSPTVSKIGTKSDYKEKVLLNDISGKAIEGQIMAFLGASGSGKSTLLDALAGRISKESLKGLVMLNRHDLQVSNTNNLKSVSAYVMQDDLFFPMLTVEETLMFSAELRLPRTLSDSEKRARVQVVIDQIGLRDVANAIIGDEVHRGISGGERKRVAIGVEIVHDPIILFLDEPTSGLDSTSAFMVVNALSGIARSGSIVILSIHQPSLRILNLIDNLIILSKGQMLYNGSPSNLAPFFEAYNRSIPGDENIIEFGSDFISELEDSPGEITKLVEFNRAWKMNPKHHSNKSFVVPLEKFDDARIKKRRLLTSREVFPAFANPFWVEIWIIGKRSLINSKRMPQSFRNRFGAVLLAGVMLGTIFRRLDDSPKGANERLGFFASLTTTIFFICAESIPYIVQERFIFMRETSYNTYRRSSYVLSHSIIVLPSLLLLASTFSAITFWTVGLGGGFSGFLWFFLFQLATFWAGHSFVTFLSALVPNVMIGYMMVVTLLAQFMLFSGFFIRRDQIPSYWIWFHYMSLVKYPYQGVLLNELNEPSKCLVRGIQMFDDTPLKNGPTDLKIRVLENMGRILGTNITSLCVVTGSDILQQQGITDLNKLNCLLITIVWGFFFRIMFYLALLIGSKNKRS